LAVVGLALGAADHRRHHGHRFGRLDAHGRLGREHHGVGAVEHGVGHVGHLGPGRERGRDHRFEHLSRGDHRPAGGDGGPHEPLLHMGHVFDR
jgi:hypothetical protein